MIGHSIASEAFDIVADILMSERDVTPEIIAELRPLVTKTPWHFGVLATWFMFLYQTNPDFKALVEQASSAATDLGIDADWPTNETKH